MRTFCDLQRLRTPSLPPASPLRRPRRTRGQRGFVSIEFTVAVALSFLFLVALTNYVVIQYGKGVVRAAADEGARAGARVVSAPTDDCHTRADDVLSGIGRMANHVDIECTITGDEIRAVTKADFDPWVPTVPVIHTESVAISIKESAP